MNETNRIKKSDYDDATKHAALRELLAKETKLLQTIDRLKLQAHEANKDAKIKKLLEAVSMVWPLTLAATNLSIGTKLRREFGIPCIMCGDPVYFLRLTDGVDGKTTGMGAIGWRGDNSAYPVHDSYVPIVFNFQARRFLP